MSDAGTGRWVILELTSRAEGEDPDLVRQAIQSTVKTAEVFVPAVVTQIGDDRVVHYLVDGYAFIRRGEHKVSSLLRLENTKYVNAVLKEPGGRGESHKLSTVPMRDIDRMRGQIAAEVDQGICIGDQVEIISGPYRNISATVVEEIPELEKVQVFVNLRSKQTIVTLPRSFLKVTERAPLSPVLSRLTALGIWTRAVKPIFQWQPRGLDTIQNSYSEYARMANWQRQGMHLYACATFAAGGYDARVAAFQQHHETVAQMTSWVNRARPLYTFVAYCMDDRMDRQLGQLQTKLMEVAWFEGVFRRIKKLRREINDLAHEGANRRKKGNKMVFQNVLVDGLNLAFRCHYAPGMSDLRDEQGRPTGMVLGFLRSLGSFRKRFPDARIYVAWDGSSRRRKQQFGDYKANRPSRGAIGDDVWSPFEFLQKILPLLGVRQAFNPDEEADDIIGTLIRKDLKGQHNLIFSNDRDFLQLVSPTVNHLVPGAGTRKEMLYDVAMVKKQFGVDPDKMIHLRAFYGDKSDNIPGVPRVPKKVLLSLVQAHGSVEGVYKSGLAGLTKGQYERLRSAEPQVRINISLMSLVDIPVSVAGPDVDPDAAAIWLRELAINPEPLVTAFLGRKSETLDMSSGYAIPIDPNELATRFSAAHDPRFDEEDDNPEFAEVENVSEEEMQGFFSGNDYESQIAPLLDRIPEREADLIDLYFIQRKRQADIAQIFNVTQAAISYRLERGIQRIKFLLSIPQVTEEDLRQDLPEIFPAKVDPNTGKMVYIDVDILCGMWDTTCQSEVAKKLGLTQGRVRHRFFKAVKTLEAAAEADEKFEPYHKVFSAIAGKKFNILREVKLPQWSNRGGDGCL